VNYPVIINQLRQLAPLFNGNVAGAAAYAHGVADQVWLPTPAAYVVPIDEEAGPNEEMNGLLQTVTERFMVIVNFDNTTDRRGQTVTNSYDVTKAAINTAILNWRPDSSVDNPGIVLPTDLYADRATRGLYAGGAGLIDDITRARVFYQWTFCLDVLLSYADGWQQPTVPLLMLSANEDELGAFTVPLPQ
jgi:hypothetical protein